MREVAGMRRAVLAAGLLNLAYFGIEIGIARAIGSVSLFADSIDFLEDAAINALVFVAATWDARRRAAVGTMLAAILLVPGVATVWAIWQKVLSPVAPAAATLSLTALGALLINLLCALMLARQREHGGSLMRAAFLSARNDVLANVAMIAAGAATAVTLSHWPDLIVGAGIFFLNLDAAREVYGAARAERGDGDAPPSA